LEEPAGTERGLLSAFIYVEVGTGQDPWRVERGTLRTTGAGGNIILFFIELKKGTLSITAVSVHILAASAYPSLTTYLLFKIITKTPKDLKAELLDDLKISHHKDFTMI